MSLLFCSKITVIGLFVAAFNLHSVPVFASGGGSHSHAGMKSMASAMHQHESWEKVPAPYAGKRYKHWGKQSTVEMGGKLYAENCLYCHGKDGRGTGPMATKLAHPPADLTNHFHCRSGQGDDYLFWRISEGGEIEPFASMGSAMPSFKDFLSEQERWAILSYVHASFHAPASEECRVKAHEQGQHSEGPHSHKE